MDGYEASRIVFSRIQNLDPENASRIMGLLLIQDHGDKEMIRLAFGPEALVHSVILRVRKELGLGLSNSPPTPSTPLSPFFYDPPLPHKPPDFYYPDLSLSPSGGDTAHHRRSCSLSDADDPAAGFGWKPCLYYARGYCKNGAACRFLHDAPEMMVDHELLRSKSAHQHRLMASAFPYSPKAINLLLDPHPQRAGLVSGEEVHKLGRSNLGIVNPASRQIYLTFPADSTFREEDVSNYFTIFGPVQDVRIPYQQKRMFGFVTFVYPDTVKLILAKGNPHFVCDARVLVKPYKEKAKLLDHKKQMDRGDFSSSSPCGTPTGCLDSRDPYDLPPSPGGMLYNNAQDMLWRRKLEEQALEMQGRRLMNLQLLDVKKHHHHRAFSTGSPTTTLFSPRHMEQLNAIGQESPLDEDSNSSGQQQQSSSEHNLPDSPFASPTKAEKDATTNTNSSSSSLEIASFKSFNCQIPRFSSRHGHGVIGGMFAGTGGSTFPVGI